MGLVLCVPPLHAATLKDAAKAARAGKYAVAEAAFDKLKRSRRGPAALGLARIMLETGRYARAVAKAKEAARGKLWAPATTLIAEAQRKLGQRAAAEATLRKVVRKKPRFYRASIFLGMVLQEQGKPARSVYDLLYDDFAADRINKKSAEELTYVAMACRYTDNFRDASDTLQNDALKVDPGHVEAYLQLAEMSLEKYEAGYAEKHYNSVLKINPNHAAALIGLARVKLEQSNDVKAALSLLAKARKTDPTSLEPDVVEAQILIDSEENLKAEASLKKALQRDRNNLAAWTMLAASHYLRDDSAGFKRLQAKVLKLNPKYTLFFRTVVKLAVRHHRYSEALALSRQAIAIDPQDWYSLADLGTNYLRLGDDKNGIKYLKEAWNGDRFNVRNYNLLNLYDDVVAKEYEIASTKHFRFKVHRSEKALILRTVAPLLERAYAIYVKKYKFVPKKPIIIELFKNPSHYAVRTVGLPGLSALGVCFGQVITSTSPSNGRFNWGQVLWHELNHVFTIQMSRSRVPRWLTEGLADMEPVLHRPEWKRENDFDIYKAIRGGRLKGLGSMTTAFSQARSIQEMVVAYYQGSLMAVHLIKNYGMDKVLELVRSYARGKRTAQTLPALTGISLAELDRQFRAVQLARLNRYAMNWFVDPLTYEDLPRFRKLAKASPGDLSAQARLAAALLVARKLKDADRVAGKVTSSQKKHRLALWVQAQVARAMKDAARSERMFSRLLAAGGDGYETRMALGRHAIKRGALKAAATHLAAAKRFDPERGLPYVLLAKAYEKKKQEDLMIKEFKGLVHLEQQSFHLIGKLVGLLAKRKDYVALRKYGQMAYYINPASVRLHTFLADAHAAPAPRPNLKKAIWHLETALLCKPRRPATIHVKLARLYLQQGDRRSAKKQLRKALSKDPGHDGAKAMQKRLK